MKNKKISALLLVMTMLVALVVPAQAAENSAELLTRNTINEGFLSAAAAVAGKTITAISDDALPTTVTFTEDMFVEASGGESNLTNGNYISRDTWSNWGSGNASHEVVVDLGGIQTVEGVMMFILSKTANGSNSVGCAESEVLSEANMASSVSSIKAEYSETGEEGTYTTFYDGATPVVSSDCVFHNMNGSVVDRISHGVNLELESPAQARYIKLTCVENGYNMGIAEIAVYGDAKVAEKEAQTLYSVTGYAVPTDIVAELNQDNISVPALGINTERKAEVIAATTNEEGTTPANETLYSGLFSTTSAYSKPQLAWETTQGKDRYMVIDLKGEQNVKLVGLYYAGMGQWESGNINKMNLAMSDSPDGPWETIGTSDAVNTPMMTSGSDKFFFNTIELPESVTSRYLRLHVNYYYNVGLGRLVVLGEKLANYWGDTLTLLTNNVKSPSVATPAEAYGYTVTKATTPARYKYIDTADNTDEKVYDSEGYVTNGTQAAYPQPDLVDGAMGDGDCLTQTNTWGNTRMNVLWDMGGSTKLDRLEIASVDGAYSGVRWVKGVKISVGDSEDNLTTVIDVYSSGMLKANYVDGTANTKDPEWTVFDLGGVQGRYVKVEMIASQYQIQLGEMYIYGEAPEIPVTATAPAFYDAMGNDWYGENTFQDVLGSVNTTISGGEGTLVVAWYSDVEDVKEALLNKIWVATGVGNVGVTITESESEEILNSISAETGALKAYVFENVLDASLVAGATELTLGE